MPRHHSNRRDERPTVHQILKDHELNFQPWQFMDLDGPPGTPNSLRGCAELPLADDAAYGSKKLRPHP